MNEPPAAALPVWSLVSVLYRKVSRSREQRIRMVSALSLLSRHTVSLV